MLYDRAPEVPAPPIPRCNPCAGDEAQPLFRQSSLPTRLTVLA